MKGRSLRVVITGPESSGKTALSIGLARHYKVPLVEEFARSYLQKLKKPYTIMDLDLIAQSQFDLIHTAHSDHLMICDTGMVVMKIWCRDRYGHSTQLINELHRRSDVDLYVLCTPDMPWQYDPLREHPTDRCRLFDMYLSELLNTELSFIIVAGPHLDRMNQMIEAINFMLQN